MENVYLPIKDTLSQAWQKTYGAKGSFWVAIIIMFLITLVGGLIGSIDALFTVPPILKEDSPLQIVIGFIFQLINYFLQMGLLYMGLLRAANLSINYKQVFYAFKLPVALRLIGTYLIEIAIFFVCIIIMIIPAIMRSSGVDVPMLVVIGCMTIGGIAFIYFAVRLVFAMAFVLERDSRPFTAIRNSFQVTKGNFWRMLWLIILELLIIIVSAIPLGIGLIWSLPFAYIIYGEAYKRLLPNLVK